MLQTICYYNIIVALLLLVTKIKMEESEEKYFAPSLFLNHGGGPYPVLREQDNIEIADGLINVSKYVDLKRLKAIIVVTAHREEDIVTISSGQRHDLVYDYFGFPPESYTLKYEAPGQASLARKLHKAFRNAGIDSKLDDKRGWDHGVFIPMMLINPSADIPLVQLSILRNQNATQHYEIGKVLYNFRREGIAIFGSGMSYHNMKEFDKVTKTSQRIIVNEGFDNFLNKTCTGDEEISRNIINWEKEPGGLESHPLGEADHLMPLIVNVGAAGTRPGIKIFESVFLGNFKLSGFLWDENLEN